MEWEILLPLGWIIPYLSWLSVVPMPFFAWLYAREEAGNFRDQKGFRARLLHRGVRTRLFWLLPYMVALLWVLREYQGSFSIRTLYLVIGIFSSTVTLASVRTLAVIQNRYFRNALFASALVAAGTLAIGLRLLPLSSFWLLLCPHMLIMARIFGERPVRMDYNLFLRAAERMLHGAEKSWGAVALTPRELMNFARFLGSRWLVTNFWWTEEGLFLPVTPANGMRWGVLEHFRRGKGASHILLTTEGRVRSTLGADDRAVLKRLRSGEAASPALEREVSTTVEGAWAEFRSGNHAEAEQMIGEGSQAEVFKVAPEKMRLTKVYRRVTNSFAALTVTVALLFYFRPPWMEGLRPVAITESQIRSALAEMRSGPSGTNQLLKGLTYPLSLELLSPPADLFTPESLGVVQRETLRTSGYDPPSDLPNRCEWATRSWILPEAFLAGWLRLEDLGIPPEALAGYLRDPAHHWELHLRRYSCQRHSEEYVIERFDSMNLALLRWVKQIGCLDVVPREALVQKVADLQVLSGKAKAGRPALPNWRDIRGFFASFSGPILEETYFQLAALELLGGLDRIDREACIRGILKLHRGRGYFVRPDTEESWRANVRGDARDTFCAFESLRILGALDRVSDLSKWKFRVKRNQKNDSQTVTWSEIEAWLAARHLQEHLARKNP